MEYKYVNLFLLFIIVILIAMNYNLATKQESFVNNTDRHNDNIRKALAKQEEKANNKAKNKEMLKTNFEEGTNYVSDSETLQDMFKAVSNSEALCDELENNQKNRDMIQQYKINESTLRELSDQKKRINELRKIVNYLRKEKLKRQTVSDKCRIDSQKKLNSDYKLVKKLSEQNLLNDNTVKIDLDVAESLKNLRKGKKRKANSTNNSVNNNVGNVAIANKNTSNGSNNGKNDKPRYATPRCPGVNTKKMIHKDEAKGLCHNCDVNQISKNYPYLMKDFS